MTMTLPLSDLILRVVASLALGLLVGLERARAGKDAGMRTHALVCLGSTVMTLVSGYAFATTVPHPDPTRIAAQIVTGIGFIGGGTILKEGAAVRGLTTAASLWATAGMGMAVGAGLYSVALVGIVATVAILAVLTRIENLVRLPIPHVWELQVTTDQPAALTPVLSHARERFPVVRLTEYTMVGGEATATLLLHAPGDVDVVQLAAELRSRGARSVHCAAHSHGDLLP
jgi:putative Mg2+ transporter-C (MgtC) family protein